MWTRDDIAEFLQIDRKTVDRIVAPRLAPTTYVGRLPRWSAGAVMEAAQSGRFDVRQRGSYDAQAQVAG
jgi:hypothetical protein